MKNANTKINKIISQLKNENIKTWFDLGLFLDQIKEHRNVPQKRFVGTFEDFKLYMCKNDFAFITYQYSIDGVSIELDKYTKVFKQ